MHRVYIANALKSMFDHDLSKKEALIEIYDILYHWKDFDYRQKFKFQEAYLVCENAIKQHLDLLIEFRRDINETIDYFIVAAETLEQTIINLSESIKHE